MREPQTTRAKVSRPRSSVPNGCARLGALRISFQSVCIGSAPAIHGAAIAATTKRSTITAPTTDAGRRRACRQARARRSGSADRVWASTAVVAVVLGLTERAPDADARIQERVGQVDQKIDQHVRAGGDKHDALYQRIVAREHRFDDEAAEPGYDEDLLGDDRPAHERARLQAENRDDRDQAVADRVTEHDGAAGQSLAVGGPDVVRA